MVRGHRSLCRPIRRLLLARHWNRNCKSLSPLRGFAAGFGLGTILPEYKRTNQRGTMAELDAQRRTVEQAYQSQFRTTKSLADVAA